MSWHQWKVVKWVVVTPVKSCEMSSSEDLGGFKWVRKKLKGWLVSTWKRVHFLEIEMESRFCGDRSKTHRRTLLWCKQNHFQVMNVIKSLWKSSTNCEPCLKNIRCHYIACDRVNFRQTKQSTSHRLFASLTWDAEIFEKKYVTNRRILGISRLYHFSQRCPNFRLFSQISQWNQDNYHSYQIA